MLRRWRQHNSATSAAAWRRRSGSSRVSGSGGSATALRWRLRQRDSATSAEAWRRHGGGGSVGGGGGSAKRGGGAQRDSGSAIVAARMLRRWRQRDVDGSLAVGRRRRWRRQHQQRWRQRDALRRRTARWRPARWQQHGGCGGFTGTVRECANARTFVFILGQDRGMTVPTAWSSSAATVAPDATSTAAADADAFIVKIALVPYYLLLVSQSHSS